MARNLGPIPGAFAPTVLTINNDHNPWWMIRCHNRPHGHTVVIHAARGSVAWRAQESAAPTIGTRCVYGEVKCGWDKAFGHGGYEWA